MGSEVDKPLLQPHEQEEEEGPEFQKESHEMGFDLKPQIGQFILKLKQLKSLEILQSSLSILNNKFVLLMVLFSIPFFIFMVFFEIKLQRVVYFYSSKFLANPSSYHYYSKVDVYNDDDGSNQSSAILRLLLELCSFYLVVYPLIELLSSSAVIKIAGKVYAGEKESTLMEIINEVVPLPSTLKCSLSTYLWVHLLSTSTLMGLFWIVANHFIISARLFAYNNYSSYYYYMGTTKFYMNAISIGVHSTVFLALLYKYLDWSALWNMGIVISVLEDERGVDALEMSGYYGKRSRGTGFELMLGFFVLGAVLRLPCLLVVGKCRVLVTAIVVGLVCLGNLVKWVALVVYFYDCKAQTLQKKIDEEVGKSMMLVEELLEF